MNQTRIYMAVRRRRVRAEVGGGGFGNPHVPMLVWWYIGPIRSHCPWIVWKGEGQYIPFVAAFNLANDELKRLEALVCVPKS